MVHFIKEIIYIAISIIIIISCFKAKLSIDKINDLEVKTIFIENDIFASNV